MYFFFYRKGNIIWADTGNTGTGKAIVIPDIPFYSHLLFTSQHAK